MLKKIIILVLIGAALGTVIFYLNKKSEQGFTEITKNNGVIEQASELKQAVSLMPTLLGYDKSQIYLVLFLNNTEIRPGGGFIGSYALVRLDKRQITMFETSGSENLDWVAPTDFNVEPPAPIKTFLKQPKWYFRDANWSPDFAISAKQAISFYKQEGGKEGDKIDAVIGITPDVVESLMKYTGDITADGQTFTAENFTDALEYHVEYGYQKSNTEKAERKVILGDLGKEFIKKISALPTSAWVGLWSDFLDLAKKRQIMFYSVDSSIQNLLVRNDWAGQIKQTNGDFLLVVDSNLASLKTDPAVDRNIVYEIKNEGDRLRAKVIVNYNHRGNFDWKTTRYRTYTRIYAPLGSELITSDGFIGEDKKSLLAQINEESGKTVFGGFLSIEPQSQKKLTVEYYLPKTIKDLSDKNLYTLFVQKALGTKSFPLTINLNFGKKIVSVNEGIFNKKTDLSVDREFAVKF